jgi:hypothetical protein
VKARRLEVEDGTLQGSQEKRPRFPSIASLGIGPMLSSILSPQDPTQVMTSTPAELLCPHGGVRESELGVVWQIIQLASGAL